MTTALLTKENIKKQARLRLRSRELEVEDFNIGEEVQPVTVDGDRLEVDSGRLEIGQVYPFSFLDTKMVLWKSEDNTVDIYQVVEE